MATSPCETRAAGRLKALRRAGILIVSDPPPNDWRRAPHIVPNYWGLGRTEDLAGACARRSIRRTKADDRRRQPFTLKELLLYFLRLGTTGLGGGRARRIHAARPRGAPPLVHGGGVSRGPGVAQLAPDPLPPSSRCTGWVRGKAIARLVGLAFVLPSFLMVIAIAVGYLRSGDCRGCRRLLRVGAAVIAIIARSALKLTRLTRPRPPLVGALHGGRARHRHVRNRRSSGSSSARAS